MRPSAPLSRTSSLVLVTVVAAALACGTDSPGGSCKNPVGVSEAPAPQVQHFGNQKVASLISFTVPPNTESVTIVEQAVNAPATIRYTINGQPVTIDNTAVPFFVDGPSGTRRIYDDNIDVSAVDVTQLPAYFGGASPVIGTLTIPNTTAGLALVGPSGLPAGTWQAQVSDYAWECAGLRQPEGVTCTGGSLDSVYDVTVITKPLGAGGAAPTAGSIDVVVHFATSVDANNAPLTAASAPTDPDLRRMEQTLRRLFSNASITIGSLTYSDLPPAEQVKYMDGVDITGTGSCSPIAELLKNASEGNKLNIFMVRSFTGVDSQSGVVVGLDGTIPGPSTIAGSAGSGAAVSVEDLRARTFCGSGFNQRCGADATAYYIAHEAGHFLGLYHVTEGTGTQFDPLAETPTCVCQTCAGTPSQCADANPAPAVPHSMRVSECVAPARSPACRGGDNLMFYLLDDGSQGTLFPEQVRVMLANPLVH